MTSGQLAILDHTINKAARQLFCGDSPDMQSLVAAGMMRSRGRVSWCPDDYFTITEAGRRAWADSQRKVQECPN